MTRDVTVYSAPLVIPVTAPAIVDGAVAVSGGRILHVGSRRWMMRTVTDEAGDGPRVVERRWDGIITPGLVNAHTHLQYTAMRQVGRGSYDRFRAWELAFNALYARLSPTRPWRDSAFKGADLLLAAGTTAAADVVTDIEAADALHSHGIHGIAYWEVMGWHNDEWRSLGRRTLEESLAAMHALGVRNIGISPHAPYTLGSAPLTDLPDIARRLGMRLHIHLAENPVEAGDDEGLLTTYAPEDWRTRSWTSFRDLHDHVGGASAVQFLDRLGCLGPDVHIAHGVWANAEDRRILRQRGVGVALCPRSNAITVSGRPAPVARYLEEGNLLAIGTDSLSSSPSLDVLDDAAMLYDMAREQGYRRPDLCHRLIRMLTLGGAEVMGLGVGSARIGQINAGATADLAFFDIPVTHEGRIDVESALRTFITAGAGSNRATLLSGRLVYDHAFGTDAERPGPDAAGPADTGETSGEPGGGR